MRVLIAHCWQGSPDAGWYPWLVATLAAQGHDVRMPRLPHPDAPSLEAWLDVLSGAAGEADTGLAVIGHSLGALAALHWVARLHRSRTLAGLLLVAPPIRPTGIAEVDAFLTPPLDLAASRARTERASVLVSDADRYLVPSAERVAAILAGHGFEAIVSPGKGHFAPASGISEVPEIAAWTKRLVTHADREEGHAHP